MKKVFTSLFTAYVFTANGQGLSVGATAVADTQFIEGTATITAAHVPVTPIMPRILSAIQQSGMEYNYRQ